MSLKYELTDEVNSAGLRRIRALRDIPAWGVRAGDLGGLVASEHNLSHDGDAWVFGNARVFGNAQVYGVNACAARSDGYTFSVVATPTGPHICAGCRYLSLPNAREHWTKTRGGTQLGDETMAILDMLERVAVIRGLDKPVEDGQ